MLRVVGKVEFSTYDTACKTAFANRYDVVYDRKTGVSDLKKKKLLERNNYPETDWTQ